jgi:hypothetical protein
MTLYPAYQSVAQLRDEVAALRTAYDSLEKGQEARDLVLARLRELEPTLHQIFPELAERRELSDRMEYLSNAVIILRDIDNPNGDDSGLDPELGSLEATSQANDRSIAGKERILHIARASLSAAKANLAQLRVGSINPLSLCDWHG